MSVLLGYSSEVDAQSCPEVLLEHLGITYGSGMRGQIFTSSLSDDPCIPTFVASNSHKITVNHTSGSSQSTQIRYSGLYSYPVIGELNGSYPYSFTPASVGFDKLTYTFKDNSDPLEGVNVWDLTLISRYILGLENFCSPFTFIAADVTSTSGITTFDIVQLRKLILGSYTDFNQINPIVDSWRFFPMGLVYTEPWYDAWFADPLNIIDPPNPAPLYPNYLNQITTKLSQGSNPIQVAYVSSAVAVKMGDINFEVSANACESFTENEDRSILTNAEIQSEELIPAGSLVTLRVKADVASKIGAWQAGLVYNQEALEITDIVSPVFPSFDKESYRVSADEIRIVWYQKDKTVPSVKEEDVYFEIHAVAKKSIIDGERLIQFDNGVLNSIFFDENGEILTVQPSSEVLVTPVVAEEEEVAVYPTLFTNILTVNFGKNIENQETAAVQLLHLDGTLVADALYSIQDNQIIIQGAGIGTLPSGMYLIAVKLKSGKEYRKKVIKA